MAEKIENVIWYSIGAFDYFIERENLKGSSSLLKDSSTYKYDVLLEKDKQILKDTIDCFKYSEEVLEKKREQIKKNFEGRIIYKDYNIYNYTQRENINNLFKTGGFTLIDDFVKNLSDKIKDIDVYSNNESFEKLLNDVFSLSLLYLSNAINLADILKYQSISIQLLNNIIDQSESVFYVVDDIKQKIYPLIRNSIFELYKDVDNNKEIINNLRTYEIIDLFTIFNFTAHVFSTDFITFLLNQLCESNENNTWPVNRYHCLKIFLLENLNPLDEQYIKLYDKYFTLENDNAYLFMALRAQYLNNSELCNNFFKKINANNINELYYCYYEDLKSAIENDDFKTIDDKDYIFSLINNKEINNLGKYLNEFDISSLSGYCLGECSKQIIDNNNYNVVEIEVILNNNVSSLYNYLSRSCNYIEENDIPSLYIFTTILLNLNLLNESYVLLKRIIEKLECEDVFVMKILELQLQMTKKFLGYNI